MCHCAADLWKSFSLILSFQLNLLHLLLCRLSPRLPGSSSTTTPSRRATLTTAATSTPGSRSTWPRLRTTRGSSRTAAACRNELRAKKHCSHTNVWSDRTRGIWTYDASNGDGQRLTYSYVLKVCVCVAETITSVFPPPQPDYANWTDSRRDCTIQTLNV